VGELFCEIGCLPDEDENMTTNPITPIKLMIANTITSLFLFCSTEVILSITFMISYPFPFVNLLPLRLTHSTTFEILKVMDTTQANQPLPQAQPSEPLAQQPTLTPTQQPPQGHENKHGWVRSLLLIILLVIVVDLGIYFLLHSNNTTQNQPGPQPSPTATPIPEPSPTDYPKASLETYTNNDAKISFRYPNTYTLYTIVPAPNGTSDTLLLASPLLPPSDLRYTLTISYKPVAGDQTLASLIDQNTICPSISSQTGAPISLTNKVDGRIYADVPCGQRPNSIIYAKQNSMFYIMTIDSQEKFATIKPALLPIFSTFTFFEPDLVQPTDSVSTNTPQQILCLQNARECPDDTWKGRTGQTCDNTCPKD